MSSKYKYALTLTGFLNRSVGCCALEDSIVAAVSVESNIVTVIVERSVSLVLDRPPVVNFSLFRLVPTTSFAPVGEETPARGLVKGHYWHIIFGVHFLFISFDGRA